MNQELTPWFVNGEKPSRPGVYNVSARKDDQSVYWFARWDGMQWYMAHSNVSSAMREQFGMGLRWSRGSWRGLAQNPKKGK